jgi:NAD(P)-dependent dehydrogenase (short-subunit alcohol dehydrogenase family)
MSKLKGRVAVITGGTEGIGLATAKLFVKEGAYVFITGRRPKELDKAAKAIGENVTGVQGDASNLADLDRLYETVTKAKGRIDIVIANAGLAEFAPFGKVTEEHFDRLLNINVKGTLFTVQKALPLLNDGGSIIITGSFGSVKGTPNFGVYGATKAALRSFVRTWTTDLKDRHIRSNVLSPGPIKTPQIDRQSRRRLQGWFLRCQWGVWGSQKKLPKLLCSWRQMTPHLSRVLNSLSMAASHKSNGKPALNHGTRSLSIGMLSQRSRGRRRRNCRTMVRQYRRFQGLRQLTVVS